MHLSKRKKPIWKDCVPCKSNCMTLGKKQNYGDYKKKKSMLTWDGGEKWCIIGTQDFYGSGTILHDIIMDMSLYNFAVNLKVIFKK